MQKLILLPYKKTSVGSRMIANSLGIVRYTIDERFRAEEPTWCINWGRGDFPDWRDEVNGFINRPEAVMNAIDKRRTLELMDRAKVPGTIEFTRDMKLATRWSVEGATVMCRKELQGKDGSGIVVARRPRDIVAAEMYTKYVPKVDEYRVHVMKGEAFYVNVKRKSRNPAENAQADPEVRTSSNGWIFIHLDKREWPNRSILESAERAVEALGLDFGGVDVGEGRDGLPSVYEVNTAPELGPNTTAAYVSAFQKHYGKYKNEKNIPLRELA